MGRLGMWAGLALATSVGVVACVGDAPAQVCSGDRPQACPAGAGKTVCIRASDDCATKCTVGASAKPVVGADVASGTLYCPSTQKPSCGTAWAECCTPEYPVFCDNTPATNSSACWLPNTNCATMTPCSGRLPDRSAATVACFNGTTPHCGKNWWGCCATNGVFCDSAPEGSDPCWPEGSDCATIAKCMNGTYLACKPGQTVDPMTCACM